MEWASKNSVTSTGTAQRAHLPRAFSRWGLLGAAQKLCELPASQPRPPSASPRGRGGRLGGKASGSRGGPAGRSCCRSSRDQRNPPAGGASVGLRGGSREGVERWACETQGLCACAASLGLGRRLAEARALPVQPLPGWRPGAHPALRTLWLRCVLRRSMWYDCARSPSHTWGVVEPALSGCQWRGRWVLWP